MLFSKFLSKKEEEGSILVGTILILTIILGLGIALISLVLVISINTQRSYQRISAVATAEAGIEKTIWELNKGVSPTCTSTCSLNSGDFVVTVTDIDSETKGLNVTSYLPSVANFNVTKTIKTVISAEPDTEGIAFNYAIQGGAGGIDVSGSSNVEGNLYSNGNVDVLGSATVELPGDVYAVGTITDQNDGIEGIEYPGSPTVPLPSINEAMWKNLAQAGGTITGNYSPPQSGSYTDLGPTEITGDFTMSKSSQKVNVTGPIHIHGDLKISGSGEWKLDDAFGTYGTIVIVDGEIDISGSAKFFGNSSGSYILFVSTNSASTSGNPAIKYTGSATGEKLALYATIGAMKLAGSGKIVAMTGETLYISGSGKIEYESGLASTEFSGGPGGAWKIKSWKN